MADDRVRRALADVEAQRDDAVTYLSAIRRLLDVVARGHGCNACAAEMASALVHELAVEHCAVVLLDRSSGEHALAGLASQAPLGAARSLGEAGWITLARLGGDGRSARGFRRTASGDFVRCSPADQSDEGFLVLPLPVGDGAGGAIVLHWLAMPAQVFGRVPALMLLAAIAGEALTIAQMRDMMTRLYAELADELGGARRTLSVQEAGLRTRERNIEQLTQSLILSNRVKREFLGTVSHELRTPLNAILGYASLLREGVGGELSPEQEGFLDRVLGSTRNLHARIDDILFFVQLDSDDVPVRREPVQVRELLSEVMAVLPEQPRVALAVGVSAAAETVYTDPALLRRILFHLLDNAFKFTAAGEVSVRLEEDGRDGVVLSVCDTGIGFAPERLRELAEVFTQGDGSTTRRYSGMGMGLSLVERCVRLLGGELQADSRPGGGSRFHLALPGASRSTARRLGPGARAAVSGAAPNPGS